MALYALDQDGHIIPAREAGESMQYRCMECQSPLQKRLRSRNQPHFYHLKTVKSCRLHSRSSDHLVFQKFLRDQNPHLQIERPFEKILRIADLCWEEKKIVFEIQCSPIDPGVAIQRMNDYAKENYTLVWLLDDRHYNRRHFLRPGEMLLREKAGYYFSFSQKTVYDQFEVLSNQSRLVKGPMLKVDLFQIFPMHSQPKLTRQLEKRHRAFYFANDLADKVLRYPNYLNELRKYEEKVLAQNLTDHGAFLGAKKLFFIGLELLLRKLSS